MASWTPYEEGHSSHLLKSIAKRSSLHKDARLAGHGQHLKVVRPEELNETFFAFYGFQIRGVPIDCSDLEERSEWCCTLCHRVSVASLTKRPT